MSLKGNNNTLYFATAFLAIALFACKLENVAPPADTTDTGNGQTVMGITVNGKGINDSYLNATWRTKRTIQQLYDTADIAISGTIITNKFISVTLNDEAKTALYTALTLSTTPSAATYKLSTSNNVLYIKLSPDPFFNSPKSELRITNLTPTSMTWVALDTTSTSLGGKYFHKAYEITFTK